MNPVPSVTALSPAAATAGGPAFTLTVTGDQFISTSGVNWNGQPRPTSYVSATQLTASISAADLTALGNASVTVTNPSPGGGTSSPLSLKIEAALPALSTRTDWQYIGAKVDAGDDNSSSPPYLAYDSARNQIFLSVPASNVVKVYDSKTHKQKAEISVPSPFGIDISADGATVYVGTATQFVYVVDPVTLHVRQVFDSSTALPGGFSSISLFAMKDGSVFIVPGLGVDGDGTPLIWSPATGSVTVLKDVIPTFGTVLRSGDRASIIVASPFTSGSVGIYNVANKSFVSKPYPEDIVERAAANPAKDQFAVSDLDGNVFIYDSQMTQVGAIRIEPLNQVGGQRLNGMVFSADGARLHLFVDQTIQEYDTSSFTQGSVMAEPYSLGIFAEPLPFAEDDTGMIFAINEEGLDFIDVSKIQSTGLTSVPSGYGYSLDYLDTNTGPQSGGTAISSGIGVPGAGSETGTSTAAYLGNNPVLGFSASGNQFSFDTPAASQPGAENLIVTLTDGTPLLAPKAFSYGPDVVRVVSTVSGTGGGGTGFVAGYGFGPTASNLQVTIGGKSAPVTKINTSLSGLDEPFATPMEGASFTVPAGSAGPADLTVTTAAGTQTVPAAFRYGPPMEFHTTTAALEAGVYDPTRKVVFYTTTNQILPWSVSNHAWLNPISVPNSTTAALTGISISPNGQLLAAADQGNQSIVVFNPDSPQSIRSLPVSDGGFGLKPASVAVSDSGKAFFNLAFTFRGGFGTRCQEDLVWELDTGSGAQTSLDPVSRNVSFCMDIADRLLLSPDGNTVYLDDGGGLALYDVPSGQWTVLAGSETANSDMALSRDNSRLFATFSLIDFSRGYLGTPAWSDLDLSDDQTLLLGEKLDRNGSLLLQPWSQALDLVDLSQLAKRERIVLPYTVQPVFDPLVWDDDNDTAYLIVNGGLLEVPVLAPPVLQNATPASGGAGTLIALTGTGFASTDVATVGGVTVPMTVTDEHTATVVAPPHANGAVVVTITAPDARSSSLDPGFTYGGPASHLVAGHHNLRIPRLSRPVTRGGKKVGLPGSLCRCR